MNFMYKVSVEDISQAEYTSGETRCHPGLLLSKRESDLFLLYDSVNFLLSYLPNCALNRNTVIKW